MGLGNRRAETLRRLLWAQELEPGPRLVLGSGRPRHLQGPGRAHPAAPEGANRLAASGAVAWEGLEGSWDHSAQMGSGSFPPRVGPASGPLVPLGGLVCGSRAGAGCLPGGLGLADPACGETAVRLGSVPRLPSGAARGSLPTAGRWGVAERLGLSQQRDRVLQAWSSADLDVRAVSLKTQGAWGEQRRQRGQKQPVLSLKERAQIQEQTPQPWSWALWGLVW